MHLRHQCLTLRQQGRPSAAAASCLPTGLAAVSAARRGGNQQHQQQRRSAGGLASFPGAGLSPEAAANASRHRQTGQRLIVRAEPPQEPFSEVPYPWDQSDYVKVEFVREPYGPVAIDTSGTQWKGVLLFQQAGETEPINEDTRVMEIFISGDACISIYTHLCPDPNARPMALDILWQMWQRGRDISKRDWTLLRVAVVACVNDVYYGRLFFGDPDTQQVLWDTDVRPSDATYLALKARAPFYVRRSVWEACATPLRNSSTWSTVNFIREQEERKRMGMGSMGMGSSSSGRDRESMGRSSDAGSPRDKEPQLNPDNLPAIRLLMREMELAVREEDYAAAARLRDHPWMRLAEDIKMHKSIGYYDQAYKLMSDLKALIDAHESAVGRDYEARLKTQQEARQQLDSLLRRQLEQEQDKAANKKQHDRGEGSSSSTSSSSKESNGKRQSPFNPYNKGGAGGGSSSTSSKKDQQKGAEERNESTKRD